MRPTELPAYCANRIAEHLSLDESVLWFVAGGSNIPLVCEALKMLQGKDLSALTITLTDERFGEVGHADSNWKKLEKAGGLSSGAAMIPVLTGGSLEETAQAFSQKVEQALANADFSLALLGLGADGHTAGIMPGAPEANGFAAVYEGADFTRISITPSTIAMLDLAILCSNGEEKWPQLDRLMLNLSSIEQPAQAIKAAEEYLIVSDQS